MKADRYHINVKENLTDFEFFSIGPKGKVKKVVQYQMLDLNFFNLAFGDWDEEAQSILDEVKTNNQDRDKVLTTVAFTLIGFFKAHPRAIVTATGSTPAWTRLYQMGIKANWLEINARFVVKGLVNGVWEPFEQNKNYDGFLVTTNEKK